MKKIFNNIKFIIKNKKLPSLEIDLIEFDQCLTKSNTTILLLEDFGFFSFNINKASLNGFSEKTWKKDIKANCKALSGDHPLLIKKIENILERYDINFLLIYREWKRIKLNRIKIKSSFNIVDNQFLFYFHNKEIKALNIDAKKIHNFYFKDRILSEIAEIYNNIESINEILFHQKIKGSELKLELYNLIFKISYSKNALLAQFVNQKIH